MGPKVSIVIPFYNCPYISQALSSAVQQSYPNLEIIVVDDGSTMHAEQIAPFRERIYYLGKQNGGTATALNHGIMHASGEYVAWLSSDDLFYPDKISLQLHYMLMEHAVISHTNFNYIDEHGLVTQLNAGASPMSTEQLAQTLISGNPVNGCTVMMKKEMIQRIGLFDESLPYTHDYEYWLRAVRSGIPFQYINIALTAYRRHTGMGTLRHQAAIQHEIMHVQQRYR